MRPHQALTSEDAAARAYAFLRANVWRSDARCARTAALPQLAGWLRLVAAYIGEDADLSEAADRLRDVQGFLAWYRQRLWRTQRDTRAFSNEETIHLKQRLGTVVQYLESEAN